MKRTPQVFIILLLFASLLGYSSLVSAQSNLGAQVAELQANLERQDKILKTLQGLTAEQARTQGELKRLPLAVEDLDEVQRDIRVIAESLQQLQREVDDLRRDLKQAKLTPVPASQKSGGEPLVIGLLALQSGDINRAVDQLQPLLTGNNDYRKDDLLMVLGNGFLQSGYPEQAASHLSTLVRTFPQSQHLPSALFSLGQAFGDMRDESRKYTIWKALIEEYPNHPMALKATRSLEAILR
ncbi:MAG: hypothetical protein P8O70_13240 [SAR324 cluster bacterium]|nr:hypothetical protein [SAR324 cluster bacterium]